MKKIDIFVDGQYKCTTTRSKTCKEAVQNFVDDPWYQGMRKDGTIGYIIILDAGKRKVTANFQK